ncbi:MAG: amidohydrolase family protein [Acidisphaera sp.]|nr:amidohydrolase family protein [Acidisphaera sp.]
MARPARGTSVVRGGRLADPARRRGVLADILITDGVIREVGPPGLPAPEGAEIIDATGLLLHPGLVNAHTHGHGGLARGQGDRWTLELLLVAGSWIGDSDMLADKKLSATICAAEMVLKGCTAAYDLYAEFPLPTVEGIDGVAEAYAETGMRAVVAPMVADVSLYDAIPGLLGALPPALREAVAALRPGDGARCVAALGDIIRQWRWDGEDIRLAVAPTIPHHCTHSFICGCARLAREHGLRIHTHVGESKVQAVTGMRRYGRTLLAQLDEWGIVGPDFTAAHAVWLDDDDMRRMAGRGATVAHNPGSNLRLGNGLFQLRRMLDLGVTVGIGTDGASCSDNQNMYEAMRLASMVSKGQSPDIRAWASAEEVWHAATRGSAQALGIADIGAIAPGHKADLVFLDLAALNWIPHNWTVNQLVHVEDGTAVRHVMVGGRMVVRDGRLLTVDLARLAREAEAARERLEQANEAARRLADRLAVVVDSHCRGLAASPYHIERYLRT